MSWTTQHPITFHHHFAELKKLLIVCHLYCRKCLVMLYWIERKEKIFLQQPIATLPTTWLTSFEKHFVKGVEPLDWSVFDFTSCIFLAAQLFFRETGFLSLLPFCGAVFCYWLLASSKHKYIRDVLDRLQDWSSLRWEYEYNGSVQSAAKLSWNILIWVSNYLADVFLSILRTSLKLAGIAKIRALIV